MTFVGGRVPSTRGALIRLRDTLTFIKKGRDVLRMKRDQLAGELNKLLAKLAIREEIEREFSEIYELAREAFASSGYNAFLNMASSIPQIKVEVRPYSVMGVIIPRIEVKEKPALSYLQSISVYRVAEKLANIIQRVFEMAEIEAGVERIAHELMMVNRKVNALEKVIIPQYERMIRYIEDRLFEEALEEFVRVKFIRDALRKRRS